MGASEQGLPGKNGTSAAQEREAHNPAALPPGPWGAGSAGQVPQAHLPGQVRAGQGAALLLGGNAQGRAASPREEIQHPSPTCPSLPWLHSARSQAHMCTCVQTWMHTQTHMHAHIHHMHTHTHTHIPVHLSLSSQTNSDATWLALEAPSWQGWGWGVGVGAGGQSRPQADPHCLPLPRLDSGTAARFVKPWRSGRRAEAPVLPGALRGAACLAAALGHGFKASNPVPRKPPPPGWSLLGATHGCCWGRSMPCGPQPLATELRGLRLPWAP